MESLVIGNSYKLNRKYSENNCKIIEDTQYLGEFYEIKYSGVYGRYHDTSYCSKT